MAFRQIYSDEEFLRWCESLKSCKYCGDKFYGPVCDCEKPNQRRAREKVCL